MKNEILDKLTNKDFPHKFGIERETLRVDSNGNVVSSPHPFKGKFSNPNIKVDFGEQQLELITNINNSVQSAIDELILLTHIAYRKMNFGEYLWMYSMPHGNLSNAGIANGNEKEHAYREELVKSTSFETQLISGVHFNWSINDILASKLSDADINEMYFNVLKKYFKFSFVIKILFGMSPTKDFETFDKKSYRLSKEHGYVDEKTQNIDMTDYVSYRNHINNLISSGVIQGWRQVYNSVKTKPFNSDRIDYLEIRNIDLDYTNEYGVSYETLNFIHKLLVFFATNADYDLKVESEIDAVKIILDDLLKWYEVNEYENEFLIKLIADVNENIFFSDNKPVVTKILESQFELSKKANQIALQPISDMELSTQILIEAAYLEGKDIKIIDRSNNIISINGHKITMSTLTPFDSVEGLGIISCKMKTNHYLRDNNFNATSHKSYHNIESALKDFEEYENRKIVIKPTSTNFSVGLTVFDNNFDFSLFKKAVQFAFENDDTILIEEFVDGKEYRFLVINSKVVGVLLRTPANIIGDGEHDISHLIEIKNKDPLRGVGYKLPLEKIKLGSVEKDFLKMQNIDEKYIPKKNEIIFLRKNSNVSTGGDTLDVTDDVLNYHNEIAVAATNKLGLAICGLDIIIPDLSKKDYVILEMNWNPAIHIHTYPFMGKSRKAAEEIIQLIDSNDKK